MAGPTVAGLTVANQRQLRLTANDIGDVAKNRFVRFHESSTRFVMAHFVMAQLAMARLVMARERR